MTPERIGLVVALAVVAVLVFALTQKRAGTWAPAVGAALAAAWGFLAAVLLRPRDERAAELPELELDKRPTDSEIESIDHAVNEAEHAHITLNPSDHPGDHPDDLAVLESWANDVELPE